MSNIYQNALDVQSASNLSGVVFQFARDMSGSTRKSVPAAAAPSRSTSIRSAASTPSRSPG